MKALALSALAVLVFFFVLFVGGFDFTNRSVDNAMVLGFALFIGGIVYAENSK